jgi:hypothetical protein
MEKGRKGLVDRRPNSATDAIFGEAQPPDHTYKTSRSGWATTGLPTREVELESSPPST